ncbi:MAG: multicopper oxidase family protein [Gemmatimonadetes bacterium]|nr:MAG: multicopper oxidase family protein [Gemmatimonadota bacterium]
MHGASGDSTGWRMPPMERPMPMLPGLVGAVPPVAPFLPGRGVDPATLPEARPFETVEMSDGDTLAVRVSLVRRRLRGRDYVMYGYNGQYPGPLIRAPRGATITVVVTNDIELDTSVHWHGVRIDNRFDGVPGLTQDPILPGESFTYQVRVPDAGLFWYHPHSREDVQQDLGLYGNLLVTSPDPDYLGPAHRDEMLVVDDLLIDERGMIPWGEHSPTHALMGRFGTLMLTNGLPDWRLDVRRGEVVRFYVTNVANTRTFNLRFPGARMKVVAGDLGRFEREAWVESVPIAPAERYVVDVRFDAPGAVPLLNQIQAIDHFRGEFYPHVDTLGFVHVADEAAPDPAVGRAFETLRTAGAEADTMRALRDAWLERPPDHELVTTVRVHDLPLDIVRSMEIDTLYVPPMEWNDAMGMMNWLSTGTQVTWILKEAGTGAENGDIHWTFRQGDLVKIRIFNDPESFHPMHHPVHVHGQRYLVIARDGVPNEHLVWKDTAVVPVGSTMDILVEMSNPGDWMVHCHIAEHLHAGMMFHFTVEPN